MFVNFIRDKYDLSDDPSKVLIEAAVQIVQQVIAAVFHPLGSPKHLDRVRIQRSCFVQLLLGTCKVVTSRLRRERRIRLHDIEVQDGVFTVVDNLCGQWWGQGV